MNVPPSTLIDHVDTPLSSTPLINHIDTPLPSTPLINHIDTPLSPTPLIDHIDALLPQTQCTRCGYDGCRPYASAIANNEAAINRCPPGGEAGIQALATLLKVTPLPLETTCGPTVPLGVAIIDEMHCIGCTRCIDACPVDAILGTAKRMHTILEDHCTGCERCIPVCPVDCIDMVSVNRTWTSDDAQQARERYHRHHQRLQHHQQDRPTSIRQNDARIPPPSPQEAVTSLPFPPDSPFSHPTQDENKHSMIQTALAQARARRQANTP